MTQNTPQTEQMMDKYEKGWRKIANVLSHGFLEVHHGKAVPIDIIEEVQKIYYEELSKQKMQIEVETGLKAFQEVLKERQRIREKVEGMKNPEIMGATPKQELLMTVSYNRALDDVLEALDEQKEEA